MCHICGTTDGGRHHYDCPYDDTLAEKDRRQIVEQDRNGEKPTKPFDVKWQTSGGWVTVK